jgi:hypothetical protein
MPITSPSYFPPSRANGSIVGITAGVNETGARLLGTNAGAAAANFTDINPGPSLVIGLNTAQNSAQMCSNVLLGHQILANNVIASGGGGIHTGANVLIGNQILRNPIAVQSSLQNLVVIGDQALKSVALAGQDFFNSVVIGAQACINADTHLGAFAENVVIGAFAGSNLTFGQGNTLVGHNSCPALASGGFNTVIGHANTLASGTTTNNVIVGRGIASGGNYNTLLGASVGIGGVTWSGIGNIVIGAGAGAGVSGTTANTLIVETTGGAGNGAMFYGSMIAGNLVIGNSLPTGSTRALITAPNGATNTVGIVNGTKSLTVPIGGGYFYVTAGALHWVGSAGTDTAIAPA